MVIRWVDGSLLVVHVASRESPGRARMDAASHTVGPAPQRARQHVQHDGQSNEGSEHQTGPNRADVPRENVVHGLPDDVDERYTDQHEYADGGEHDAAGWGRPTGRTTTHRRAPSPARGIRHLGRYRCG